MIGFARAAVLLASALFGAAFPALLTGGTTAVAGGAATHDAKVTVSVPALA